MKMSMVSLGCDKNTVDSEMMLGLMNEKGFEYTDIDEEADVMIINTCGFIQSAKYQCYLGGIQTEGSRQFEGTYSDRLPCTKI